MKEQGQSHAKAFQDFEDAFKSKLDAVMSEARPMGNRWGIDGNRWESMGLMAIKVGMMLDGFL